MRNSFRKQAIRKVLQERETILLDELRWIVLELEAGDRRRRLEAVTRSQMTSFSRTVREHMPELSLWEIGFGEASRCPTAIVAATAVYRLPDRAKLSAFLKGTSPAVECRYVKDLPVSEFGEVARYVGGSGFAQPQYHLYLCDLYSSYEPEPAVRVHRIRIPPAHKATVVQLPHHTQIDFQRLSAQWHWKVVSLD